MCIVYPLRMTACNLLVLVISLFLLLVLLT
jgi:hypothetical protein